MRNIITRIVGGILFFAGIIMAAHSFSLYRAASGDAIDITNMDSSSIEKDMVVTTKVTDILGPFESERQMLGGKNSYERYYLVPSGKEKNVYFILKLDSSEDAYIYRNARITEDMMKGTPQKGVNPSVITLKGVVRSCSNDLIDKATEYMSSKFKMNASSFSCFPYMIENATENNSKFNIIFGAFWAVIGIVILYVGFKPKRY